MLLNRFAWCCVSFCFLSIFLIKAEEQTKKRTIIVKGLLKGELLEKVNAFIRLSWNEPSTPENWGKSGSFDFDLTKRSKKLILNAGITKGVIRGRNFIFNDSVKKVVMKDVASFDENTKDILVNFEIIKPVAVKFVMNKYENKPPIKDKVFISVIRSDGFYHTYIRKVNSNGEINFYVCPGVKFDVSYHAKRAGKTVSMRSGIYTVGKDKATYNWGIPDISQRAIKVQYFVEENGKKIPLCGVEQVRFGFNSKSTSINKRKISGSILWLVNKDVRKTKDRNEIWFRDPDGYTIVQGKKINLKVPPKTHDIILIKRIPVKFILKCNGSDDNISGKIMLDKVIQDTSLRILNSQKQYMMVPGEYKIVVIPSNGYKIKTQKVNVSGTKELKVPISIEKSTPLNVTFVNRQPKTSYIAYIKYEKMSCYWGEVCEQKIDKGKLKFYADLTWRPMLCVIVKENYYCGSMFIDLTNFDNNKEIKVDLKEYKSIKGAIQPEEMRKLTARFVDSYKEYKRKVYPGRGNAYYERNLKAHLKNLAKEDVGLYFFKSGLRNAECNVAKFSPKGGNWKVKLAPGQYDIYLVIPSRAGIFQFTKKVTIVNKQTNLGEMYSNDFKLTGAYSNLVELRYGKDYLF